MALQYYDHGYPPEWDEPDCGECDDGSECRCRNKAGDDDFIEPDPPEWDSVF
jgi:hypothetical protein